MSYTPKHKDFKLPPDNTLPRTGKTEPYVFDDNIAIAVDIALATGRPLLVAGDPGSGKSRLAEAMATLMEWNYLDYTMTSRTRLEDLTADYDHLQRLHDAQTPAIHDARSRSRKRTQEDRMKPDWAYFKPGLFWWAFNKDSAARRGGNIQEAKLHRVTLEYPGTPTENPGHTNKTVLLIDEIDKAEPDLPNDLLEPLDRRRFTRPDGKHVNAGDDLEILTIITTNRERELPAAFMRRCVSLVLKAPIESKLETIAHHHFPDDKKHLDNDKFTELVQALAAKIITLRDQSKIQNRRPPSTSEFLDAVRAGDKLKIGVDDEVWKLIEQSLEQSVLIKDLNDKNDT